MKPKFITIEGIDGSGKSTVAKAVYQYLKRKGYKVKLTTEPTNTMIGQAVKEAITKKSNPFEEVLFFMVDRVQHTQKIRNWLEKGISVISDRYCDSTYAYQGATLENHLKNIKKDSVEWLKEIGESFTLVPDMTFLLIVEPKTAIQRLANRRKVTKFERLAFLKQVQNNYMQLAKQEKRFIIIDANKPLETVTAEINHNLAKRKL